MSIRPPRPVRTVRNTTQLRETSTIAIVAFALVTFGLRAALAIIGIHTWTVAWKIVAFPTVIVVAPLQRWSAMERTLAGNLTAAEALAALVIGATSIVVLSSLANRRM